MDNVVSEAQDTMINQLNFGLARNKSIHHRPPFCKLLPFNVINI